MPLLQLSGIGKRFGAVQALADVDLEVAAGTVVGLAGDNGAGKTTLLTVVAGACAPDSGEIRFAGRPVVLGSPHDASRLGIATVYQDRALCDHLDVTANLFLGRELTRRLASGLLRTLDDEAMERQATELLRSLGATVRDVRQRLAELSAGQRQSVAIARALLGEPKVVLLDEPTAALGIEQTRHVLDLIRQLRDRGLAVVVVSHDLGDLLAVCDRIVVMRLGRRVGSFVADHGAAQEVVAAITGAAAPGTR